MEKRTVMVTGGAGFIGSHLVHELLAAHPEWRVVNVDKLSYAGNLDNLADLADEPRHRFVKADICDGPTMIKLFEEEHITRVFHLAAESHVDRSIHDPLLFERNNVRGTLTLLDAARLAWTHSESGFDDKRFLHVSTDEVYGTLGPDDRPFREGDPYQPHSPYSASKASSDHFARAFHDTYGMPTMVSNCSNNYGPNQFPEKLIPLIVNNIRLEKPLPIYGAGLNVRDWLHVDDHAAALDLVCCQGEPGQTYNIGGGNEWKNIDIVRALIAIVDELLGRPAGSSDKLITYVTDRPGHDLRYAIDSSHLQQELGWTPRHTFADGLRQTAQWYLDNQKWVERVTSGEYQTYYKEQYGA